MSISLIISTYNWPEALGLVLDSVAYQTKIPDEIIIADDGSDDSTSKLIENFKSKVNSILNIFGMKIRVLENVLY